MSDNKCKDGVTLPSYGPCPMCGATADQNCRGREYGEFIAKQERKREEEEHERMAAELMRQADASHDRRKP